MSKKNNQSLPAQMGERLINGLFKENPTFVLLLGMCPTLAVTTSAMNGLGMGLTTTVVLAMSNLIISALRKVIPDKIRIPAFIVIIASFVTIVELLLEAYIPSLYAALGIYIPLIVVNCIILGRAEAYAYSNPVIPSLFDGLGMGLGFTLALTIIGGVREILGSGAIFGVHIMPASYVPVSIFVMAPGAFFVLALLTAIQNKIKEAGERKGKDMSKIQSGCGGNCLECEKDCKVDALPVNEEKKPAKEKKAKEKKVKEKKIKDKKAASGKEVLVTEEEKVEETKAEEVKTEEAKAEEVKAEEVKAEEVKAEEVKAEEVKTEEVNSEEIKPEETDSENDKQKDKSKEKTLTEKAKKEKKKKTEKSDESKVKEPAKENVEANGSDDDLEVLELDDLKKIAEKKASKKPVNKKANKDKAMMMLSKAEETLKEDEDNA